MYFLVSSFYPTSAVIRLKNQVVRSEPVRVRSLAIDNLHPICFRLERSWQHIRLLAMASSLGVCRSNGLPLTLIAYTPWSLCSFWIPLGHALFITSRILSNVSWSPWIILILSGAPNVIQRYGKSFLITGRLVLRSAMSMDHTGRQNKKLRRSTIITEGRKNRFTNGQALIYFCILTILRANPASAL